MLASLKEVQALLKKEYELDKELEEMLFGTCFSYEQVGASLVRAAELTTSDFKKAANKKFNKKYTYAKAKINKSLGSHSVVTVTCRTHGDFVIEASSHLRGYGCKLCKKNSKGERLISSALSEFGVYFETERTFPWCINPETRHRLRFDFYIPSHNLLIEFDGEQHFMPHSFGSDKSYMTKLRNFEKVKKLDSIKNSCAKAHGVTLVRIPYTQLENISSILLELLDKFKPKQNYC